jgi:DNA-binding NarL/FixJ family response regulator
MDINQKTIFWLIGEKNIQNSLLLGHLQQNLDLQCAIIDVNVTPDLSHIKLSHIVGIDALGLQYNRCSEILEQLPHKNKTIFINLKKDYDFEKLLNYPCVRGFFYKGVNQNNISKGMTSVLNGDLWFNRKLLGNFMACNRKAPVKQDPIVCLLTKREKQILKLCASGSRNLDIADTLNVSTHTVKTHLYNLFKKLNVGNRIQAINWAQTNLPEDALVN